MKTKKENVEMAENPIEGQPEEVVPKVSIQEFALLKGLRTIAIARLVQHSINLGIQSEIKTMEDWEQILRES